MGASVIRPLVTRIGRSLGRSKSEHAFREWALSPHVHPTSLARGFGGRVVDHEGREYVDVLSAWGANLLGYGYPRVAEGIASQAWSFSGLGVPHPEMQQLHELLCDIIPCAEEIRFGKNGSDVTAAAVRLARSITGRDRILCRGYHGFHDWYMAATECQGVPGCLRGLVRRFSDISAEIVDEEFRTHPGEIACLILDPLVPDTPQPAEMEEIVRITRSNGAVVIFDEIGGGLRVAPGGMQEVWGITPDLACYGKAVGNGMPLTVLAGRTAYMKHMPRTFYGMTYEGEAVSIAAARATVLEVLEKDVCASLADKGKRLKQDYSRIAAALGIPTRLTGPDARPNFCFDEGTGVCERELRWLLTQELVDKGIMNHVTFNFCYSHTDEDLATMVAALEQSLAVVHKAIARGSVEGLLNRHVLEGLRATAGEDTPSLSLPDQDTRGARPAPMRTEP